MSWQQKSLTPLVLGAIGVVFGDIGTSPLYALKAIFGSASQNLAINQINVYGVISLVLWAVILVVSVKYIGHIMRADNKGEGGIMALVALIKSGHLQHRRKWFFIGLGLVGVALFYGDSAITPAISVLSAVEGITVIAPDVGHLVVPITIVVLTSLFVLQRFGTGLIGRMFGPIMLLWFVTIGAGGAWQVLRHPDILQALSPLAAVDFVVARPLASFIAMGAVVLVITGAEALYADMGHFGRRSIARAWFFVVFPALALCYLGQGALLLHVSNAAASPFFLLFPAFIRVPVIVLATAATFIASQSVISGAFSLTRQAVQLNFMPKMLIRYTSARLQGQIYVPLVNKILFVVVMVIVVGFGSSEKLASAYGIAVSGALLADSILFLVVMRSLWGQAATKVAALGSLFVGIDLLFVASSSTKLFHGGWFPLTIAALTLLLISTWLRGQAIVSSERHALEGSLQAFVKRLNSLKPPIARVPGQAVYIAHHSGLAPLALHATVEKLHELHEKAVIVYVQTSTAAHIPEHQRAVANELGFNDGISQLNISYGFHDTPNIPKTLKAARQLSSELDFDPDQAAYFVSLTKVVPSNRRTMSRWRKSLYCLMDRNALSASDYYKLPTDRTVEMRTPIEL